MRPHEDLSIVFVHGWATDSWVWEKTAGALGHENVMVNLPGHGGENKWDTPDAAPAVKEIRAAAAKTRGRPLVGVGWSLGALSIMTAALEDRSLFSAVILVGATPSFVEKDGFPWAQSRALVKRMLMDMKKDPASTLERFYPLNFTADEAETDAARDFVRRYRYPGPLACPGERPGCHPAFDYEDLAKALEALCRIDIRSSIGKLDVPALIVHGASDAVTPPGAARFLSSEIKGSRLVEFDGSGHAPFLTAPEEFTDVVKGFIEGL